MEPMTPLPLEETGSNIITAGNKIFLRRKRLADAGFDYAWETDHELAQLDAAPPITITFPQYLMEYAGELCRSLFARWQFAIEAQDGEHIGNCVYYNVDETEREAELGVMIGNRDYWDRGYGTDTVATLVNHIFCSIYLRKLVL